MKSKNETDSLNELIILEEQQYDMQLELLKEQFHVAYESLRPINLIKSVFHEVTASPEIKNDLANNVIGLGTGFLSKKLMADGSHSPLRKMIGTVAQFAIANLVSKHSDTIKTIAGNLLKHFFNKQKN
ncbi:hypothetical protein [Flavobacterium taihuense]|uniref:Uncharacterized protein n=1 Tax=Flavobacterium taihuense TaxID=2857508 RepID=A0ABS6XXT7_9FLAO|nr:hypothetical protein [Flavobacterium taihuense]MBW4361495.1 hypothetical protein [Flavobacterium taihuense]